MLRGQGQECLHPLSQWPECFDPYGDEFPGRVKLAISDWLPRCLGCQYKGVVDDVRIYDRAITKGGKWKHCITLKSFRIPLLPGWGTSDNAAFTIDNYQLKIKAPPASRSRPIQNPHQGHRPHWPKCRESLHPRCGEPRSRRRWPARLLGNADLRGARANRGEDYDRDGQSNRFSTLPARMQGCHQSLHPGNPAMESGQFQFTFKPGRIYRLEKMTSSPQDGSRKPPSPSSKDANSTPSPSETTPKCLSGSSRIDWQCNALLQ